MNINIEIFIHKAPHNLLSPANHVRGLINVLDGGHNDPRENNLLVPLLQGQIERLKTKIKELLAIRRDQETGKKKKSQVEFQNILDEVSCFLNEEIQSSGAEISSDFSKAPVVNYSKKDLKCILQKLISNAVKRRHSDRKPDISLCSEKLEDTYILLNIKENGYTRLFIFST